MISGDDFVAAARELGFDWYAGVPCSYLAPLINRVIDGEGLCYVSSANEGDAVAAAAGASLAGRRAVALMQNSGLGNAVNPITSLLQTFRIPVLLLVTLRGDPELGDEPQHRLMGSITTDLLDAMQVPWEFLPDSIPELQPALGRALQRMERSGGPFAFVVRKTAVQPVRKGERPSRRPPSRRGAATREFDLSKPGERLSRHEVLERVQRHTEGSDWVVIASTGYTGRELYALDDRAGQLYMVGSMGCASSIGLGLALARPDLRVLAIDGDGALLMRLGNLATVGSYGSDNFWHLVLDNEMHESTGGQSTVSAGVAFARLAAGCGYRATFDGDDPTLLEAFFAAGEGPRLAHMKIRGGVPSGLPRPDSSPEEVARRLKQHIGAPA